MDRGLTMMIDYVSGIYPLDAACHVITPDNWQHNLDPPAKFDIEAEVSFIGWLWTTSIL